MKKHQEKTPEPKQAFVKIEDRHKKTDAKKKIQVALKTSSKKEIAKSQHRQIPGSGSETEVTVEEPPLPRQARGPAKLGVIYKHKHKHR